MIEYRLVAEHSLCVCCSEPAVDLSLFIGRRKQKRAAPARLKSMQEPPKREQLTRSRITASCCRTPAPWACSPGCPATLPLTKSSFCRQSRNGKAARDRIGGRSYAFKAVLLGLALEEVGLMPAPLSDTPENEEAVEFALAVTRQLVEYERTGKPS